MYAKAKLIITKREVLNNIHESLIVKRVKKSVAPMLLKNEEVIFKNERSIKIIDIILL